MTARTKRFAWLLIVLAIIVALYKVDVIHRFLHVYVATKDCFNCRMSRRVAAGASAFLVDPKLVAESQPTIIGGRPARPNEFPAVGALFLDGLFHCTGTLIRHRVVLTAAHCICEPTTTAKIDVRRLRFAFGIDARMMPGSALAVTSTDFPIGVPEREYRYDPSTNNDDLALVFIEEKPAGPPPYNLPTSDPALPGYYRYVGFGRVIVDQPTQGIEMTACIHTWRINARRVGHGDRLHSVCLGDSGGPALNATTVIGSTSTTTNCQGGASVNVAAFLPWINNRIQKER